MAEDTERRRVTVDGFQAKFIFVQLIWAIAALSILGGAILGPLTYGTLMSDHVGQLPGQARLFQIVVWSLLAGLVAMLAAVFVRMSHRVAGPLHNFVDAFREIGAGRLDVVVKTRPKDYLKREQNELNAMVVALRARVRDSQKAVANLDQRLATRLADPRQPTHDEIKELHAQVRHVTSTLSQFTVS